MDVKKNKMSLRNIIEKSLDLGSEYHIQVPTLSFINCANLRKKFNLSKLHSIWKMEDTT